MKKILSFIFAFAMVMSLGSVPVFAADTNTITSTDEGSNSATQSVKANYTPVAEKAAITSVSVTVDSKTYNSGDTVTLTPNSGSVTITVKGNNFTSLNSDNHKLLYVDGSSVGVSEDSGWKVNDENTEASKTFELSTFQSCTTAFEIKYSNEGDVSDKYTGSGIYIQYQNKTVSVGITWGAMNFTYSDEQVEGSDKGWTCEKGANTVKVENNGTESITAEISYKQADDYKAISGTFDKTSETIAKDGDAAFTLTLSGKPDAALSETKIGTVTVAITDSISVATESDLKTALTSGGNIKLTDSIKFSTFSVSTSTPIVLDLNGKTLTSTNEDGLIITSGSKVTITDSVGNGGMKVDQIGVGVGNSISCYGTVVIDSGNYQGAINYDLYFGDNGDVTINGGTFGTVCGVDDGTITIKGGEIANFSCGSGVTVYITGGTIKILNPSNVGACIQGKTIITGGTFNFDPSATGKDNITVDTTTHTVTKNGDGTWTVTKKQKN